MGYSTNFSGKIQLNKKLSDAHFAYLEKFAETRRMKRNPTIAEELPDPIRTATGLPIGVEGGYFVGGLSYGGQAEDRSVTNNNVEPEGQPGLWCQCHAAGNRYDIKRHDQELGRPISSERRRYEVYHLRDER